jgi:Arm DNA-binding domain
MTRTMIKQWNGPSGWKCFGDRLYLEVRKDGRLTWFFRWKPRGLGLKSSRLRTLGSARLVSFEEARTKADELNHALLALDNPAKVLLSNQPATLGQVMDLYLASLSDRGITGKDFRNREKVLQRWGSMFACPMSAFGTEHIQKVLGSYTHTNGEAYVKKTLDRLISCLLWAAREGIIDRRFAGLVDVWQKRRTWFPV